jgi:integrase
MTRAAKGEGRPFKRAQDGRSVVVVLDAEGKRRYLYGWSSDEVLAKRDDFLSATRMGLTPPTGKLSVGKVLDDWLADRRGKVRPATWISYEGQVRIHLDSIRRIQLVKLRPGDVRRLLRDREAAGCAPRSVAYTLTILRMALGQAVRDGLVPRNIGSVVDGPRVVRAELEVWTAAEARQVLEVQSDLHALWALLLGRGLRLGEALGLRWSDIDLAGGKLRVTGSIRPVDRRVRAEGAERLQRVEPKTEAGWRTMALPDFVAAALRDHRADTADRPVSRLGLVFTTTRGTPIDPRNVTRAWTGLIKVADVKRIRIHDARHSCVAILLGEGATLEDVKRLLGHETIATTSDLYGHLVESRSREMANVMQRALGGAG